MASLIILYWRDIPSQVIVKAGRTAAKRELSERFIRAIDAAAMHAGAKSADAYLDDWRRGEPIPCGDDLEARLTPPPRGSKRNTIRIAWRFWPSTMDARPGVMRELRADRAYVTPAKRGSRLPRRLFQTGRRAHGCPLSRA